MNPRTSKPATAPKIGTKLALVMSAITGMIAVFIMLYFPAKLEQQAEHALAEKAHSIATMTAMSVGTALLFEDQYTVEEALSAAKQNQDLAYIVVVHDDGRILAAYNQSVAVRADYTKLDKGDHESTGEEFFCTAALIVDHGRTTGRVYLGLSLAGLHEATSQNRATSSIVAVIVFLVGVAVAFIVGRVVSRPLSRVVEAMEVIAGGDLAERAPVLANDEVGHLAQAFNLMADNVESAHRALEGMNQVLEERVDERTHSLLQEVKERRHIEAELRATLSLLNATLDATADGILVVSMDHTITGINQRFIEMWRVSPALTQENNGLMLMEGISDQLNDPGGFIKRILEMHEHPDAVSRDICEFKDGRVFERFAYPQRIEDRTVGRVISYRDITTQRAAEAQMRSALQEKEVLLKEIHHRVKNNLQVISSLLNLQSQSVADPRDLSLLMDSQNRVRSMALIHDSLYRSPDLSQVKFRDYVGNLIFSLVQAYKTDTGRVTFMHDVEDVTLRVDKAIPCGLIINELVSNALKHGFPGDRKGTVKVTMFQRGDTIELKVADTGVGLPPGMDFRKSASLGLELVTTLTEQLGGTLTAVTDGGAVFTLVFPA